MKRRKNEDGVEWWTRCFKGAKTEKQQIKRRKLLEAKLSYSDMAELKHYGRLKMEDQRLAEFWNNYPESEPKCFHGY